VKRDCGSAWARVEARNTIARTVIVGEMDLNLRNIILLGVL
jgi:hypothetical protein